MTYLPRQSVNIWYSGHNIYIYISFTIRKQILNPSGRSYVNNSSHFEIWIVIQQEALSSTSKIKSININQWLPRVKFPCKETFYKSFHDKFTQQNQVCTVIVFSRINITLFNVKLPFIAKVLEFLIIFHGHKKCLV